MHTNTGHSFEVLQTLLASKQQTPTVPSDEHLATTKKLQEYEWRLRIHDVRTKEVLHAGGHSGALVQKTLSSVPVNQTCSLHRREQCRDFPPVVALLDNEIKA